MARSGPALAWHPALLGVLLLLALWWLIGLGNAPLFDVDEGAFSEASREMLRSGDWGHTTLNGADRFDKPILIYWFQSASLALFGMTEFAARLPSALAGLWWCWAVGRFAQEKWGTQAGLTAGAMLGTTLGVSLIGRAATADALLNALLCNAALDLWRHLESGERAPQQRAFLWMGLGLLTKGPVACLVPGAAVGLYLLSTWDWARLRRLCNDPWAWVLLLSVSVPWYAYALNRHGMAFVEGFILKHNVGRYMKPMEGHGGGPGYALAVVPALLLPWSPLLWPIARALRQDWGGTLTRYLWCWAGFVLVFFSLSGTKLPHYLIYGLTPLVLLGTRALLASDSRGLLLALLVCQLLLLGLLANSAWLAQTLSGQTRDGLAQALLASAPPGPALGVALAVLLAVLLVWAWRWRRGAAARPQAALWGAALLMGWVVQQAAPWWAETLQGPVRQLAHTARESGVAVSQWQVRLPSLAFYLQQPTPQLPPQGDALALTRLDRLDRLGPSSSPAVEVVQAVRGLALVRARPGLAPAAASDPASAPGAATPAVN